MCLRSGGVLFLSDVSLTFSLVLYLSTNPPRLYGISRSQCLSMSQFPPSHRATVHVRVNDVNEFSPVFVERRYEASVPEGRLFDRIVRVEALDADCSPQYSQICFYDIITPNVPFAIDNDGENHKSQALVLSVFSAPKMDFPPFALFLFFKFDFISFISLDVIIEYVWCTIYYTRQ